MKRLSHHYIIAAQQHAVPVHNFHVLSLLAHDALHFDEQHTSGASVDELKTVVS